MIDGLYWETLYNNGYKNAPGQKIQPLTCPDSPDTPATAPCPVEPANRNVMYENRMLGFPRIRMVINFQTEFITSFKKCLQFERICNQMYVSK